MTTEDEFILHGGNRGPFQLRALVLLAIAVIAIVVLINALQKAKGDANGSVGAIVFPVAVAVGCLGGLVMTLSQWWEDVTSFSIDGDRLGVRHGTRGRGRTVWLDRHQPVVVHGEPSRGAYILFLEQAQSRVRLGDSVAIAPLQSTQFDAWMRSNGVTVEHRWDKPA